MSQRDLERKILRFADSRNEQLKAKQFSTNSPHHHKVSKYTLEGFVVLIIVEALHYL